MIKIELEKVKEPKKPVPDTRLNIFEKIKANIYVKKQEAKEKMIEAIKKIIIQKLIQWIMKIGGTWIIAAGVSQNSVEEIVAGIVSVVISMIWSLIQTGKLAITDPKEILRLK